MPYDSFTCPNCEHGFRVIWPEPLPSHYHCLNSKITMKCPHCGEINEVYGFLIDKIKIYFLTSIFALAAADMTRFFLPIGLPLLATSRPRIFIAVDSVAGRRRL
jgi:hypothetical protein